MNTLAERLASARTDAGMTQAELAKAAGLRNQSIIGSLESGYRKSSSYIPAIAAVLKVSALWLADGVGEKHPSGGAPFAVPPAPPEPDPKHGKDGASLLRRFAELYKEYEKLPANEKALMDEALAQQAALRRMIKGGDD